ncbi:MAG: DUF2079 domain-containing protein [archaeon]|nr:DUF2079 domain-containing protein [archaeon]
MVSQLNKGAIIVVLSALLSAHFVSSLLNQLNVNNSIIQLFGVTLLLFVVLWAGASFIVSWFAGKSMFYSMERDAYSFLGFIVLLLFLFAPMIAKYSQNLPAGFENFPILLFAKLLLILALALFIAIKVLFLPKELFELYHKKTNSKITAMHLTVFIAVIFFLVIGWMLMQSYYAFNIPAPDLWIFNQSFWNSLHGSFMYSTRLHANFLGDHFALFLLALLPVYALIQSPIMLMLLQTAFIALSVVPIYLIAKKQFDCKFAGFSFAAAFLAFPALTFIALRHFHPIALSIPLLLFAFYFFQENKIKHFFAFIFLSLFVQETVALTVFFFGLWIAFSRKNKKIGLTTSAIALIYFIAVIFFIIPSISGMPYRYLSSNSPLYANFGSTPIEIISNIILNPVNTFSIILSPQKIGYLASLFISSAWLSLFSLPLLLVVIPVFAQNLLSSVPNQASIYFHYNAEIVVFLFLSAIFGLQNLINFFTKWFDKKMLLRSGLFAILVASLLGAVFLGSTPLSLVDPLPMPTTFEPKDYSISAHDTIVWKAISMIPAEANVRTESLILVQTSSRAENDYFPYQYEKADYILLDQSIPSHDSAMFPEKVQELRNNKSFQLIFEKDKVLLFKKV